MLENIKDIIFPPRCAVCDAVIPPGQKGMCSSCRMKLSYISEPRCMKCGKEIEDETEEYCDDWIRFSLEKEDQEFISSLGLEFNKPVKLNDDGVSKLIAAAEDIFNSAIPNKKTALHHILCAILIHISENAVPVQKKKHNYYDEELDKLKKQIYDDPSHDWNIPEIAEKLNISVSHFQRLYKNRFGVSCMNDVFMSRMEYAKQLLMNTELTANEISEKCGFNNYEYFSRSFAKYACMSPIKYRSKHKE